MRRHIEAYEERVYDMDLKRLKLEERLKKEEEEHKDVITRKNREHEDQIRKKDKEIKTLDDRVKRRYQELIEVKKDLVETMETVKSCDRRADFAVKKYEDLKEEMEKMKGAQIDEQSPVAIHEKPGPDRGEETDTERPSPLQTTTGGNLADTEGEDDDATFAIPSSRTTPYKTI